MISRNNKTLRNIMIWLKHLRRHYRLVGSHAFIMIGWWLKSILERTKQASFICELRGIRIPIIEAKVLKIKHI